MSNLECEWISKLPELEGLFVDHGKLVLALCLILTDEIEMAAALVRPFSLLSLPFFRRKPSTPSTDRLAALRLASTFAESDQTVELEEAVKALVGLRNFVSRFKEDSTTTRISAAQVELLLEGYLRGFHIASRVGGDGEWHWEMAKAAKDCLSGYCETYKQMQGEGQKVWIPHLLGAMFPPGDNGSHLFTPLLDRPRQLTVAIQHHHIQRPGGKKALRDSASQASQADPVKDHEEEAIHHLDILAMFTRHLSTVESLTLEDSCDPSPKISKAKMKAIEDDAKRRPLRIALETRLTQCELATALASADVVNIKTRARGRSVSSTPELLSNYANSSASSDEQDVKPNVRGESSKSFGSPHQICEDRDSEEEHKAVHWEEQAEQILYDCLEFAQLLLANRHSAVLTAIPQRLDWLDTVPIVDPPRSPMTKSIASESDEDDDSGSESDSGSDLDPSSSQAGATPLRALFRLQDRYEELRLAVWLSLPPDSRGKMSAYMRGAPTQIQMLRIKGPDMGDFKFKEIMNGRIGEAWDRFGMALLKEFDR